MTAEAKENETNLKSHPFTFLLIIQILNLENKSCNMFFSTVYKNTMNVLNNVVPLYLEVYKKSIS